MPSETTPMMQQYLQMKEQNKDAILFFRLGDFYEMFNEDALLASRELDLTLTSRDRSRPEEERTPMCGVPYHSCEGYIARLIAKGYKVAICEQTEDPAAAKGLVKRDIIRVVTPGTVDSSMLEGSQANYICGIYLDEESAGVCFCDVTTGRTHATAFSDLDRAVSMDKFEWADYMLGYVNSTLTTETDETIRQQADAYAARLAQVDSNTVPIYLAEYYFSTGRTELGLEMVEKYVDYVSSDQNAWQNAFALLEGYETDSEIFRAGVVRIAGLLEDWNARNMGGVTLTEANLAFIARMGG